MYLVAKLVGQKKVLLDSAKASHILRRGKCDPIQLAAANQYIDSLKISSKSGSISFSDAATTNSQDPGSASKGGDLGNLWSRAMMVPEFNDAVFKGKVVKCML